jgi:hypothetical protein
MSNGWNTRWVGKEAGSQHGIDGVRKVEINSVSYFVHRIIWKMCTGAEPQEVDHENKNPADNTLRNLRAATESQNRMNRSGWRNKTLPKGVAQCHGKFQASIRVNHKAIHLGTFATSDAAYQAYCIGAILHHGEFASLT